MRKLIMAVLLLTSIPLVAQSHGHNTMPDMSAREVDAIPSFRFQGTRVFVVGGEHGGPPVLLLHELPGMTPQCFFLAREIADHGFTVYMPLLFGQPGVHAANENGVAVALGGDFTVRRDVTSPVIGRLRVLADEIHSRHPHQKVGVIGMCITGNLAPAFLDRPYVNAAVMSQPALPTLGRGHESMLALSAADIVSAKARNVPILAFRFDTDTLSTKERRQKFIDTFGAALMKFRSLPATRPAHAVLTTELFMAPKQMQEHGAPREAFEEMIRYLHERLGP